MYNASANELTKQTLLGTDTTFDYDSWGRMTSKAQGSYSADYEYRYGDKLKSVTSDFPGEGTVEYEYGGDGKRRICETASSYRWYNWDAGWNVISAENSVAGTLAATYIHDPGVVAGSVMAHSQGSDPSSGTWRYYMQDIIGSTRRLRDSSESSKAWYEYTPYGEIFGHSGESVRYRFTGQEWDEDAEMYYFPFRYYAPGIARWMTRDPMGMVDGPNVYTYVGGDPINQIDVLGLLPFWKVRDAFCKTLKLGRGLVAFECMRLCHNVWQVRNVCVNGRWRRQPVDTGFKDLDCVITCYREAFGSLRGISKFLNKASTGFCAITGFGRWANAQLERMTLTSVSPPSNLSLPLPSALVQQYLPPAPPIEF